MVGLYVEVLLKILARGALNELSADGAITKGNSGAVGRIRSDDFWAPFNPMNL